MIAYLRTSETRLVWIIWIFLHALPLSSGPLCRYNSMLNPKRKNFRPPKFSWEKVRWHTTFWCLSLKVWFPDRETAWNAEPRSLSQNSHTQKRPHGWESPPGEMTTVKGERSVPWKLFSSEMEATEVRKPDIKQSLRRSSRRPRSPLQSHFQFAFSEITPSGMIVKRKSSLATGGLWYWSGFKREFHLENGYHMHSLPALCWLKSVFVTWNSLLLRRTLALQNWLCHGKPLKDTEYFSLVLCAFGAIYTYLPNEKTKPTPNAFAWDIMGYRCGRPAKPACQSSSSKFGCFEFALQSGNVGEGHRTHYNSCWTTGLFKSSASDDNRSWHFSCICSSLT